MRLHLLQQALESFSRSSNMQLHSSVQWSVCAVVRVLAARCQDDLGAGQTRLCLCTRAPSKSLPLRTITFRYRCCDTMGKAAWVKTIAC